MLKGGLSARCGRWTFGAFDKKFFGSYHFEYILYCFYKRSLSQTSIYFYLGHQTNKMMIHGIGKNLARIISKAQHVQNHKKCNNISTNFPVKKQVQKTLDDENKFKVTYVEERIHPPPTTKHSSKRNSTWKVWRRHCRFN